MTVPFAEVDQGLGMDGMDPSASMDGMEQPLPTKARHTIVTPPTAKSGLAEGSDAKPRGKGRALQADEGAAN